MSEKMFPIQSQRGAKPHPLMIPWNIAELAYSVYSAEYGRGQSLERLAERGGFGPGEMDMFLPGWRERCDALAAAQQRVAEVERERDEATNVAKQVAKTNTMLRKIAANVPSKVWLAAKETAGFGVEIHLNDPKLDEAWVEFVTAAHRTARQSGTSG